MLRYLLSNRFYNLFPFLKQIIIVGDKDEKDTKNLLDVVNSVFIPNRILLVISEDDDDSFIARKIPLVKTFTKLKGKATAYVCENFSCSLPVNSSMALKKLLTEQLTVSKFVGFFLAFSLSFEIEMFKLKLICFFFQVFSYLHLKS